MKYLNNLLDSLAVVFWLCAIFILGWQIWDWFHYGIWTMVSIHVGLASFFDIRPASEDFITNFLLWNVLEQPLLLALALLGVACNGLARIFDR